MVSTGGFATAARAMASSWRCPCERLGTIAGQHGVVALRQALYKAICVGQTGGGDALFTVASSRP